MLAHIRGRNVNYTFVDAWWRLRREGVMESSRNGSVLVMPGPVVTEYFKPCERVLFDGRRDANPVFHLLEAIWMLAGARDGSWLLPFNAGFKNYLEGDNQMHGAYGHRWRVFFGHDQIHGIVRELKAHPHSRQAVLQMWDSRADLGVAVKDKPCNTHVYFDIRHGKLNMTVCCRSNDMLWGAYGSNVVHFSMLQELIAHAVGVEVGVYRQFSNNFHVYTDNEMVKSFLDVPPGDLECPYAQGKFGPTPMLQHWENWQDLITDCENLVYVAPNHDMRTQFMHQTVQPLMHAYLERKLGNEDWRARVSHAHDTDWRFAFIQWADRREVNKEIAK